MRKTNTVWYHLCVESKTWISKTSESLSPSVSVATAQGTSRAMAQGPQDLWSSNSAFLGSRIMHILPIWAHNCAFLINQPGKRAKLSSLSIRWEPGLAAGRLGSSECIWWPSSAIRGVFALGGLPVGRELMTRKKIFMWSQTSRPSLWECVS